eukprot:7559470-Pyramimonas_sp.AAC.1
MGLYNGLISLREVSRLKTTVWKSLTGQRRESTSLLRHDDPESCQHAVPGIPTPRINVPVAP